MFYGFNVVQKVTIRGRRSPFKCPSVYITSCLSSIKSAIRRRKIESAKLHGRILEAAYFWVHCKVIYNVYQSRTTNMVMIATPEEFQITPMTFG
jgi:hypothetical protein